MRFFLPIIFIALTAPSSPAQMWNGTDTLYGFEWIDLERPYYKIKIAEDGIYRIEGAALEMAGIPIGAVNGREYRLFHLGREIPMYVSTAGPLSSGDYLEFFGEKNRSELDSFLFQDPSHMLNPDYSLYTDTAVYFLTWKTGGQGLRYTALNNDLVNPPEKEAWFWGREKLNFNSRSINKTYDAENLVQLSHFDEGQGFSSNFRNKHDLLLEPREIYTGQPAGEMQIRLVSDPGDHLLRISVAGTTYYDNADLGDQKLAQVAFDLDPGDLKNNMVIAIEGGLDNADRYSVSMVDLRYRRHFQFGGQPAFLFELEASSERRYFEIEDFDLNGGKVVLYDLTHHRRLEAVVEAGLVRFALPPLERPAKFVLVNETAGIKLPSSLLPVSFRDLRASGADYIIISHSRLLDDGQGNNPVQEYADYRQGPEGGGYEVEVVEVKDIYNSFGYGLPEHALALRNFCNYLARFWPRPQFVFLIGHGHEYEYVRKADSPWRATHFVPPFGDPGTDNLMLSSNTTDAPLLAVGRLDVHDPSEIRPYLDKVRKHEAGLRLPQEIKNHLWRKEILHLVGGSPNEQPTFEFFLNNLKQEIENNGYGGLVTTIKKTSTDPIQTAISDVVINKINDGLGIKTFLGHGAVTNTGFGLDDPFAFDNRERYPLILSLGCLTGNIYVEQLSVSKSFVLAPERGAVVYIASAGFAYANILEIGAKKFYELMGGDLYGAPLGVVMKETQAFFENNPSFPIVSLIQQLTYHGDPAIRMHLHPGPDYLIDYSSVQFDPSLINAREDSFEVDYKIVNIGRNARDTFEVLFRREFPDQTIAEYRDTVITGGTFTGLSYRLPVLGERGAGRNRLYIRLDASGQVAELPDPGAEQNNELRDDEGSPGISFFVIDNSAQTVYPPEFAILSDPEVVLKASTTDAFAPPQDYIIEVDTTQYFNSPFRRKTTLNRPGGLIKWQPDVDWQDNRVYYWRVSPDSLGTANGQYNWSNSSFVYLVDSPPGWNQSHFFQFLRSELENVTLEEPGRELDFTNSNLSIIGEAQVLSSQNLSLSRYLINNSRAFTSPTWWRKNLAVAVFDTLTGMPWENPPGGAFGAYNQSGNTLRAFVFRLETPEERKKIMDFLEDVVPAGFPVLLFTNHFEGQSFAPEEWAADSLQFGQNLFQVLEKQGASLVRLLEERGSVPYIIAFVKDRRLIDEKIGEDIYDKLSVIFTIPSAWDMGTLTSPLIGPARRWGRLSWQSKSNADDEMLLRVWGFEDVQGDGTQLLEMHGPGNLPLDQIDASRYPYLQLEAYLRDTADRTAPQIPYWRIFYEGYGDAAVAPQQYFALYNDSLQQGEFLEVALALENAGPIGLDSLLVQLSVQDQANQQIQLLRRFRPLGPGDTLHAGFRLPTQQMQGLQQLILEANPGRDQPELYSFNNIAIREFFVDTDRRNPLLEVTFDGERILDGDIVSTRPDILISLRDENQFLLLQDTNLIDIRLQHPDGRVETIDLQRPEVSFFPASESKKNIAQVLFQPELSEDGIYKLSVNGRDASGNAAGAVRFQVSFEVYQERMLSNVLPYPNPFSTACRFAYILTGDQPPDFFKIQIMTVSGRVVREITQQEFGPLKVGKHLSDFVWDGRDEFGDRLANGVYLYRVVAKSLEDGQLKRFETSVDKYFKKDFGKLVILR